ncbi:MAG: hypothetical protein QG665_247 [Patescibacteria group bacterium]|nr:hypothetical protein [Patescibacteria group bacterium]
MLKQNTLILLFVISINLLWAQQSLASSADLKVAGWIPYWSATAATKDARTNLAKLDAIYPFTFTVKKDGTIHAMSDMEKSVWTRLFKEARTKNVAVIPTIMWSDATAMQNILSNPTSRAQHIENIITLVEDGKYDGIDIDYEGKQAQTKDSFSLFIEELKNKLKDKTLVCTIEARTPPESLYKTIPNPLIYANDYIRLGRACDVFQIMAYDQQRADIVLNETKKGTPYAPTADVDWARKVVVLALQTVPKEKIMLGIPTYGAEHEITVSPNWYRSYKKLWALNPEYGVKTAKKYKTKASTNSAGELAFSYLPKNSEVKLSKSISIPKNTPKGLEVAARALAYANQTGETIKFNYVSWSDAGAIKQKINLAKEFDLRGVAIFKIDGGEDKKIWGLIK